MSDAVKIALIGFGGSVFTALMALLGQMIINKKNREKRKAESEEERRQQAVSEALNKRKEEEWRERTENRLTNIEEKLDVHNGYAEKLGAIEKSIAVIENDIKTLYKKGE